MFCKLKSKNSAHAATNLLKRISLNASETNETGINNNDICNINKIEHVDDDNIINYTFTKINKKWYEMVKLIDIKEINGNMELRENPRRSETVVDKYIYSNCVYVSNYHEYRNKITRNAKIEQCFFSKFVLTKPLEEIQISLVLYVFFS